MKDDLISRRAAIDALCDNCDNVQAVCPHYPCKQYTAIDALPSALPEHSGGLYVDGYNDGYRNGWKEGRVALRKEIWVDDRDRLD